MSNFSKPKKRQKNKNRQVSFLVKYIFNIDSQRHEQVCIILNIFYFNSIQHLYKIHIVQQKDLSESKPMAYFGQLL